MSALDCNPALLRGVHRGMPLNIDSERVARKFVAFLISRTGAAKPSMICASLSSGCGAFSDANVALSSRIGPPRHSLATPLLSKPTSNRPRYAQAEEAVATRAIVPSGVFSTMG